MSKSVLIKSSLAKKYWMAGTGLFLCLFLVGHLVGNLQLLLPSETAAYSFNLYAKFMTTNPSYWRGFLPRSFGKYSLVSF